MKNLHITEAIDGNVIVILGNVKVDGDVNGIVVTVFGDADINAKVSEQVVTVFRQFHHARKGRYGKSYHPGIGPEAGRRVRYREMK